MIVCVRTVAVPVEARACYLTWIAEGQAVREAHGIPAEFVCEPSSGDGGAWLYHPARPRHLRRLDRHPRSDALTASAVHQAVQYNAITRYDVAAGYLNVATLARGEDQS